MDPTRRLILICKALWTLLRGSLIHTFDPYVISSDLPGVNPATLNGMILYYRLMTKWSGLGDSTELSRMRLSQWGNLILKRGIQQISSLSDEILTFNNFFTNIFNIYVRRRSNIINENSKLVRVEVISMFIWKAASWWC
jgi:hypothetical protein